MARPSQERTIIKRYRVNDAEGKRIAHDAAEAGMDESSYTRHRLFNDAPLTTGKGMKRQELIANLADITQIIRLANGHEALTEISQRIAQRTINALQDDNQEP